MKRRRPKKREEGPILFEWAAKQIKKKREEEERLKKLKELAKKLEAQKKEREKLTKEELYARKKEYVAQLIHYLWVSSASALERMDPEYKENFRDAEQSLSDAYEALPESDKYYAEELRRLFQDRLFTTIYAKLKYNAIKEGLSEMASIQKALEAYFKFIRDKKPRDYVPTILRLRGVHRWLGEE